MGPATELLQRSMLEEANIVDYSVAEKNALGKTFFFLFWVIDTPFLNLSLKRI